MKQNILYDRYGLPLSVEAEPVVHEKRENQIDYESFQKLVQYSLNKINFLPNQNQNSMYGSSDNVRLTKYKQSEVRKIVKEFYLPSNQTKIVDVSKQLVATSTQYRRLINHFAGMIKFASVITPIEDLEVADLKSDDIRDQYRKIGKDIRNMNMSSEFRKFYKTALIEDVAFGWIHETATNFFIQKLDYKLCRISSIDEGVFNFAIDMSSIESDETKLTLLPIEITKLYRKWKVRKARDRNISDYVELPSDKTICIKVSDDTLKTFPFFAGVFDSIYDVEAFKQLRKDSAELANYMALALKLPIRDSNDNNDFKIDATMYSYFNQVVQGVVPEQVGVFTTPMDVDTIKFDNKTAGDDGVEKATKNVWNDSGISSVLFNTEASSTTQGLASSIKTDEEIVFSTLAQFEAWVNKYLRNKYKSNLIFNVSLLPITVFNQKEMYDMYLSAGQYGLPVKSHIASVVGLEPIEVMSMAYLENEVLKMHETFIPLQSSHTQSGDENVGNSDDPTNEGGRSKLPESERSEETQRNDSKPSATAKA